MTGRHPLMSDKETTFYMGATEVILGACSFYVRHDGTAAPMDASLAGLAGKKATDVAASMGTRILATAYRPADSSTKAATLPNSGLVFSGFMAMLDPPRKGVDQAISTLTQAGVQVVMITGDSEPTARSIAAQLGIRVNNRSSTSSDMPKSPLSPGMGGLTDVLTGADLDTMSQRQLTERIAGVSVFARTTPRHKLAIIEAFQNRGKIVAMTGDGGQ